jgi:hypothetical protein
VIAVRFCTGKASAAIAMAGPLELKARSNKMRITKVICLDDFEKTMPRMGNPVLIQDYPTPGLLTPTGQGVYSTAKKLQIRLPDIIATPLKYMAEMNTPLPMVVVGYQLSNANFRRALSGKWAWVTLVLSLIVSPLITLGAVLVLGLEPLIALILVVIMATPPAAVLSLFSQRFGKDTELASSVVSVFTLASVVTMPLVIGLARVLIG